MSIDLPLVNEISSLYKFFMPQFPVSPAKQAQLENQMRHYGIKEEDLEENFIRASGAGGQKINKTSSCVQLTHKPTGVQIRSQTSRSQALNRFIARRLLLEEIIRRVEGKKSLERQRIEKIRRQKRKRSKKAKEKMLGEKKKQSEKKKNRRVSFEN